MATDSIMGLFSTPEQYQQAQYQQILDRNIELAKLNPMQRGVAQLGTAAYQLGGAIGSALGAQDPMLQLQTLRNQVVRQIDWTNPESIAQGATQLMQQGDSLGARQVAEEGRAAALKKAQADKAMRTAGATTVSERNRNTIKAAEVKLSKNEQLTPEEEADVRWLISQETKPKIIRDDDTGQIIKIDPLNVSVAAPRLTKMFGLGASESVAPVSAGVTTTAQTKVPTTIKKELGDVDQNIVRLQNSINNIDNLSTQIDEVNLGLVDNLERGIRGFFGRPTEDTQKFKQLQREMRKQANELLLLAKGVATEGDAQRARDQLDDNDTWKNAKLLKAAFEDLKKTQKDTQKELEAKRTTLTSSGVPSIPGLGAGDIAPKKSPMSNVNPQLQPSPDAPRATHRYNPSTGRVEAL